MKLMSKSIAILVACVMFISVSASNAVADDVVVDGVEVTFGPDDVLDSLLVTNGGRALLYGTTVSGRVVVEGEDSYMGTDGAMIGGDLNVRDGGFTSLGYTDIEGNLLANGALQINMWDVYVGGNLKMNQSLRLSAYFGAIAGNIQLKNGADVLLHRFVVGGNVQLIDNVGLWGWSYIRVLSSDIGGNLQVFRNDMPAYIQIDYNAVGGNLECKGNSPTAIVFSNVVEGLLKLK